MYISDSYNHRIRKVNTAGIITTFAGTGVAGYSGDGGPAINAKLNNPWGLAFDSADNLYVSDPGNGRIRKITPAGIISTYAGNGTRGYSGDGGPAIVAQMYGPLDCAVDQNGNLYVCDELNYVVRKISPAGNITILAGNGTSGYSGDNGPATAAQLSDLRGISVDNVGNVYVGNRMPHQVVRKINTCVTASVLQQPLSITLCGTGNASFSVTASNATSYQWQLNTGTGWINLSDNNSYSGSNTPTLSVTGATPTMNHYQYRCGVSNICGTLFSTPARLSVNTKAVPAIAVTVTSAIICEGTTATFTAATVNGGTTPVFQWKKNGKDVGTNTATYADGLLNDGDLVSCVLTSNDACLASPTATANVIEIGVKPVLSPSITISPSANNICAGASVTFSALVQNGGNSPSYQWTVNGTSTGGNSSAFSSTTLSNGDRISCLIRSDYSCPLTPTASSDDVLMSIKPQVTPSVIIAAQKDTLCPGTSVSFRASTVNSGKNIFYQWEKNGVAVGINTNTYVSDNIKAGDVFRCAIETDGTCLTTTTALSNSVTPSLLSAPIVRLDHTNFLCMNDSKQLDAGVFASYLWNNSSTGRTLTVSDTGTYFVTVTDKNGCKGTDTASIKTFYPIPQGFLPGDTAICSYGKLELKALSSYQSYQWSTGGVTSSIMVEKPGRYWLQVQDNNGCKGKDSIDVALKDCLKGAYIPAAFTPNGDSKNDVFRRLLFGKVKHYTFTIYNRWGQVVFQSSEMGKGWNGKVAGTLLETSVFVWTCTYQFEGGEVRREKGTVTVIK
ncbi:gliding motility-associated C-terminal domain-containing protein [Flavisolibacter sp. BT320]|nr:gliding motility-associated C-terminal domain-containing protein [Flavisolibacter longurius]